MDNSSSTVKSPCVGLCSTTYGDNVCRGCMRFSHEVRDWNGYSNEEKQIIWKRLSDLRDQVFKLWIIIESEEIVKEQCRSNAVVAPEGVSVETLGSLLLKHVAANLASLDCLDELGLRYTSLCLGKSPIEVVFCIDRELYRRSKACYEMSYRVTIN